MRNILFLLILYIFSANSCFSDSLENLNYVVLQTPKGEVACAVKNNTILTGIIKNNKFERFSKKELSLRKKIKNSKGKAQKKYKKQLNRLYDLDLYCYNSGFESSLPKQTPTPKPTLVNAPYPTSTPTQNNNSNKGYLCRAYGYVNVCYGQYPFKTCNLKYLEAYGYQPKKENSSLEAEQKCNDLIFNETTFFGNEYIAGCKVDSCTFG